MGTKRKEVDQKRSGKYDLIMGVREERHMILDHNLKPTIPWQERMYSLSQHRKPFYVSDGSFYISTASYVRSCKFFEEGNVGVFPISRISGIEIDEVQDLELARLVAENIDWWSDEFQTTPSWAMTK